MKSVRLSSLLAGILGLSACSKSNSEQTSGSAGPGSAPKELELLNVSYDPTRELWRDLNEKFIAKYEQERGTELTIKQSHGGSSAQARAVIDGLKADVVTLATYVDTDAISKKELIKPDWINRLPQPITALLFDAGLRRS